MRRRTAAIVAFAAVACAGGAYIAFRDRAPEDPYTLRLASIVPTGGPIHVERTVAVGDRFATKGTFTYRQRASGRFGKEPVIPSLDVDARLDGTRRVEADVAGWSKSRVEATLDVTAVEGSSAPRSEKGRISFSFRESAEGGATSTPIRIEGVGPALVDYLETVKWLWSERPPLPARDVRVGEAFDPESVMDLVPFSTRLWISFRFRDPSLGIAHAPVEGRVWVDSRDADAVIVKTALRHAFAGETGPLGKRTLHVGYVARVDGTRRIALADGVARSYDVTIRTRVSVKASDLDYVVETVERTAVTTTKER